MPEPDVMTTLDVERQRIQHREKRLSLPAISVQEWAELHGQSGHTAKKWATGGELDAWKSGGVWLVRPLQPVPPPKPQGAAAHRK